MIIDDFNVLYPVGGPTKADPKLVIDTDGVLPEPLTLQGFQPIARRAPEVFQHASSVYCFQLAPSDLDDIRLKSFGTPPPKTASVVLSLNDRIMTCRSKPLYQILIQVTTKNVSADDTLPHARRLLPAACFDRIKAINIGPSENCPALAFSVRFRRYPPALLIVPAF
jgi:hypothetical protein